MLELPCSNYSSGAHDSREQAWMRMVDKKHMHYIHASSVITTRTRTMFKVMNSISIP